MDKEELVKAGVRKIAHNGETYFSIDDVKLAYPDVKFELGNAVAIGDVMFVRVEDIKEMTEFDKKILQTLKFRMDKKEK